MPEPVDNLTLEQTSAAEVEFLRSELIADIRRVAGMVDLARGLSFRQYEQAGGRFTIGTVQRLASWKTLCQAAGVPCGMRGGCQNKQSAKEWQKTKRIRGSGITLARFEAALNLALGREKMPMGINRMVGSRRKRGPRRQSVLRDEPILERAEIIADIREVSHNAGLLSPDLLNWESYCAWGGRYRFDHMTALGGFLTLRRASCARAA